MTAEELMVEVKKLDDSTMLEFALLVFQWLMERTEGMKSEEREDVLNTAIMMAKEHFA